MADPDLKQILARLGARLDGIDRKLDQILAGAKAPASSAGGGAVASDADLDGEHGDPTVRKDPPRWEGESFVGCRYSECHPDFLDVLAGFLDWQAGKDEKGSDEKTVKNARYKRLDAARARGWAARNRKNGAAPRVQRDDGPAFNDGDLPI